MTMKYRHPLLWMACTDYEALAICPRGERFKQITLGGLVLTASGLAGLGTFGTAHELGVPVSIAAAAGLLAGLMIMNFDRHVIAAMKRQDKPWKTLLGACPRLAFAVAAGQVVTMVILVFLFSGEIAAQVGLDRQHALDKAQALIDRQNGGIQNLVSEENAIEAKITSVPSGAPLQKNPDYRELVSQLNALEPEAVAAQKSALCELDGTCGSKAPGSGPNYLAKKKTAEGLAAQVTAVKAQLTALTTTLNAQEVSAANARRPYLRAQLPPIATALEQTRRRKAVQEKELVSVTTGYDGPLARWDALGELAAAHASMRDFKLWLWLTLLFLDTSPALMKVTQLMGRPSLYELSVDALEQRAVRTFDDEQDEGAVDAEIAAKAREARKKSMLEISDIEAKKTVEVAKDRIDRETAAEKDANRLLDEGQRARNLRDIDEWNDWLDPVAQAVNAQRWEQWLDDLAAKQSASQGGAAWAEAGRQDFADLLRQMMKSGGPNKSTSN